MTEKPKYGSIKWILRLLAGLSIAIMCYFFLSIVFDTPLEREIKKSSKKLASEYDSLETRYNHLQAVISNLAERDSAIYRIIFESAPYDPSNDTTAAHIGHEYDKILAMTNKELGDLFNQRLQSLDIRTQNIDVRNTQTTEYFFENADRINSIPSIQPVINPDLTLLAASFGNNIHPFYKTMSFHKGVDYAVPVGSAVFATADGVVSSIQSKGAVSGLGLKIEHGANYTTSYMNLDRIMVKVGNRVQKGDIIAFSGNSGLSFAPHLHYEVSYKGKQVDPLNFFFMELDMDQHRKLNAIAHSAKQSFD